MDLTESDIRVRPARSTDTGAVDEICRATWPDRAIDDYIPSAFRGWIEGGSETERVLVAEVDDRVVGLARVSLLTDTEAWCSGMRVAPSARGAGVGRILTSQLLSWARERGAAVARNLVFSWNGPGLGLSRAVGFEPLGAWRWAYPTPNGGSEVGDDGIGNDPAAAWLAWANSEARAALGGVSLHFDEAWALVELTRGTMDRAADETAVLSTTDPSGTSACTYRSRTFDREPEGGGPERWAEYGVAAWNDVGSGRTLFEGIERDAATVGADRCRVLIPETPRHVTDAAAFGIEIDETPSFVLAADLTGRRGPD